MRQSKWNSDFLIIPVKKEKRGIPLKVFLFSEKFPVEKAVSFDFKPE